MSFDFQFMFTALLMVLNKLPVTLFLTFTSLVFGFFIAIAIALARLYNIKGLSQFAEFYVSFMRGTPLMLHIFLVYYGIPVVFDFVCRLLHLPVKSNAIPLMTFVIIAFSLNIAAFLSETIRSGIMSVNKGEIEAAYSVGMTTFKVFKRIILPQALVTSIPNFCNTSIGLLHGTALAFYISVIEMTGEANIAAENNWKYFESYVAAALIYWGVSIIFEQVARGLEYYATRHLRTAN